VLKSLFSFKSTSFGNLEAITVLVIPTLMSPKMQLVGRGGLSRDDSLALAWWAGWFDVQVGRYVKC